MIDDLLGGLSTDLEKIGVRTTAKGHCASCNKCIVGKVQSGPTGHKEENLSHWYQIVEIQTRWKRSKPLVPSFTDISFLQMITALGEVWHLEHFVCTVCKMELSTTGFFERDGRPYCDKDYHQLFSPRCAYCKGPIMQVRTTVFIYNPASA